LLAKVNDECKSSSIVVKFYFITTGTSNPTANLIRVLYEKGVSAAFYFETKKESEILCKVFIADLKFDSGTRKQQVKAKANAVVNTIWNIKRFYPCIKEIYVPLTMLP